LQKLESARNMVEMQRQARESSVVQMLLDLEPTRDLVP
jgi:hypothetical protein